MREFLAENIFEIKERIARAARKSDRPVEEIKLVAVSKTHPSEMLEKAIAEGLTVFGENKVQEAEGKIERIGRSRAEWHLIGHLQSNKARKAVRLFDVIQTVDSVELAARLERICAEENRAELKVFVQVDLAGEATKNGCPEKDLPDLAEFLIDCRYLKFSGLMTLPPFFEDAEKVRPFFRRLRALREAFCPTGGLSMGMSHDFETAVEEGATVVRVGTAIFGERDYGV